MFPSRQSPVRKGVGNNESKEADGEDGLMRSMKKLSIDTKPSLHPSRPSSRASPAASSALPALDRLTLGSPGPRPSPRSSTHRTISNGAIRPSSPALLRKASLNSIQVSSAGHATTPTRRPSSNITRPAIVEDFKRAPTASSVARDYFQRELLLLHATDAPKPCDTVVILHDACFGHRYSRPKTTKGDLSTIVERPERIMACIRGIAMAYVRLGGRHRLGKAPIHPSLDPETLSPPFRILKTERMVSLNSPPVTNIHGSKWMEELTTMCHSAGVKLAAGSNELQRPDVERGPGAEEPPDLHSGDLYLSTESLAAFEGALGAICEAVDVIFSSSTVKKAFVSTRPPGHHCSVSQPSGFCFLNNVHVAINHAMLNHGLTHAAIIDFDLHHGDGSQEIAWAHNQRSFRAAKNAAPWKKTSIGYFSLHDINSYPCEDGDAEKVVNASVCVDNAHGQNVWNVHLEEWGSDADFWRLYENKYVVLLEKAREYLARTSKKIRSTGQKPKAAIFVSAGFDASEWEGAGMQRHTVNVPTDFYARITRDIVLLAAEDGIDGRVISVLEGGYSNRALCTGVLSHLSGLAGADATGASTSGSSYDSAWWSREEVEKFDVALGTTDLGRKMLQPEAPTPTYCSPTQSFVAKTTATSKFRRSPSSAQIIRPPTPPPPDVEWHVAAVELSKLLVPSDRITTSCTWDELKAEAARIKRQALPVVAGGPAPAVVSGPSAGPIRKSLRERKPARAPSPVSRPSTSQGVRSASGQGTRAGSSQSVRPGTSMTVRTQPTSLASKKTRPGAHARKASASKTATTTTIAVKTKPPVKIKVLTKDMKEARQKAEVDKSEVVSPVSASGCPAPSGPDAPLRWNSVKGSAIVPGGPVDMTAQARPESSTGSAGQAFSNGFMSPDFHPGFAQANASHRSGPVTPVTETSQPSQPSSSPLEPATSVQNEDDVFVSYQPQGIVPTALPWSAPQHFLASNVADTAAGLSGAQKPPTFTATSAIPFAARGNSSTLPTRPVHEAQADSPSPITPTDLMPATRPKAHVPSVWDGPESPDPLG